MLPWAIENDVVDHIWLTGR